MDLININGVSVTNIESYKVSLADIQSSDSGRGDDGVMNIETVRRDVATIDLQCTMLSQYDLERLITALSPDEIPVSYYWGSWHNATMYKGDRSIELKYAKDTNESYWVLSVSLIEY